MSWNKVKEVYDNYRKTGKQPLVVKLNGKKYIKIGGSHFTIKTFEFYLGPWLFGPLSKCKCRDK